jgi:hypothetical protein
MSHTNLEICLSQIRGILKLPPQAPCAAIVAKVRETTATADLAGEALRIQRDSSMAITPETFASWDHHDMDRPTELTLFSDGSGILCDDQGERIHEFDTPSQFAAFFD